MSLPDRGPVYRLRSLGATSIDQESGSSWVQVLGPGKPFALLVYLAACPHRSARREELLELFWADRDAARARNNLRQLVWSLRQRLSEEVIAGDEHELTLAEAVHADRTELLSAIEAGEADRVVTLYAGPFLPALALPGALEFEHWAEGERARFRAAFLRAGDVTVRKHLDAGRPADAVRVARRVRDEEPTREAGWRSLLESLSAAGEWISVQLERSALDAMLAEEGREAEPETAAVLRRLENVSAFMPISDGRTLVAELAGREGEFATLLSAWSHATNGRSTHVHVTGAAGLGKTRLLHELQQRLKAQGARVVVARANPGEQALSWALAGDIAARLGTRSGATAVPPAVVGDLVELAPTLSRQFPNHQSPSQLLDEDRRRSVAIHELLVTVADDGSIALLIDDMHWADDSSVALLSSVLHRLDRHRVLIVTAGRPESRQELSVRGTRRLVLQSLQVGAIHEMVASIGSLPDEAWARELPGRVHAASEGSPLAALEALAHAIDVGALRLDAGTWTLERADVLEIELVRGAGVSNRLQELKPELRVVLELMATAGWALSEATLIASSGLSRTDLRTQLDELDRQGFARSTSTGWEIAHDRIRDVLVDETKGRDSTLYARLGAALLEEATTSHDLKRACTHLRAAADLDALARAAARFIQARRQVGDPRPVAKLIAELLGSEIDAAEGRNVLRRLPIPMRLTAIHKRWSAAAVAVIIAGAAMAMVMQPPAISVVVQPVSGSPLTPAPVVEVVTRSGRPFSDSGATATVSLASGPGQLVGGTTVPVVNGRATFDDLSLPTPGAYVLRFSSEGFRSVDSDSIEIGFEASLSIRGGQLNGTTLTTRRPVVHVAPSTWLLGEVEVLYSSPWIAASVFMCGAYTWGKPSESSWDIYPVTTPARGTRRVIPISIKGPSQPGRYRILLAVYADRSCDFVMSSTNWTYGHPVWDDGNDLAFLTDSALAQIQEVGTHVTSQLRVSKELGPKARTPAWLGLASIEIVVE